LEIAKKESKTPIKATRAAFLDPPQMAAESAIGKVLETPEAKEAIRRGAEFTYRTLGGVLEDQPQKAIAAFHKCSIREVQTLLSKMIFKVIGLGEGISVQVIQGTSTEVRPHFEEREEEQEAPDGDQYKVDVLTGEIVAGATVFHQMHQSIGGIRNLVDAFAPNAKKADVAKLQEEINKMLTALDDAAIGKYTRWSNPQSMFEDHAL